MHDSDAAVGRREIHERTSIAERSRKVMFSEFAAQPKLEVGRDRSVAGACLDARIRVLCKMQGNPVIAGVRPHGRRWSRRKCQFDRAVARAQLDRPLRPLRSISQNMAAVMTKAITTTRGPNPISFICRALDP